MGNRLVQRKCVRTRGTNPNSAPNPLEVILRRGRDRCPDDLGDARVVRSTALERDQGVLQADSRDAGLELAEAHAALFRQRTADGSPSLATLPWHTVRRCRLGCALSVGCPRCDNQKGRSEVCRVPRWTTIGFSNERARLPDRGLPGLSMPAGSLPALGGTTSSEFSSRIVARLPSACSSACATGRCSLPGCFVAVQPNAP